MGEVSWPTQAELDGIKKIVSEMSGRGVEEIRVVISPYRICPLGAHIDHQGGTVSAMTINKGIMLGFVPSGDTQVVLHSGQFKGEVRFRVNETHYLIQTTKKNSEIDKKNSTQSAECDWGCYARGALYALQSRGNHLVQGIIGYICGSEGLDSSGLSSSAAVGVAYLLALESANNLTLSPTKNIEYDCNSGSGEPEPLLCNVEPAAYQVYKFKLEPNLAKRAEHFFSENMLVIKGLEAWAAGELEEFGKLMSASGLSSIKKLRMRGVLGARFSGAGFRGCCVAVVDADQAFLFNLNLYLSISIYLYFI